jgi:hypothetical protein
MLNYPVYAKYPLSNVPPFYYSVNMAYCQVMNNVNTVSNDFSLAIELVASAQDKKAFIMLFEHFAPRIKSFALKAGFIDDEGKTCGPFEGSG